MSFSKKEDLPALEQRVAVLQERMSSQNPNHQIFTTKELAEALSISTRTLQNWRDEGLIGYSKIGGTVLYRWSDVLAVFQQHFKEPLVGEQQLNYKS